MPPPYASLAPKLRESMFDLGFAATRGATCLSIASPGACTTRGSGSSVLHPQACVCLAVLLIPLAARWDLVQTGRCACMQGVAMTIGKIAPAAGISWVVYEETRIMLKCADRPCRA